MAAMFSLFWKQCEARFPGQLYELFKDSDYLPSGQLYSVYAFTDEYISKHPNIVRAFVAAMKEASIWVRANPRKAKDIISDEFGIDPANMIVPNYAPGTCIPRQPLAKWVRILQNYNFVARGRLKLADIYTNRFNPGCDKFLASAYRSVPNSWLLPSGKFIGPRKAK
jgi:hypothetical protein